MSCGAPRAKPVAPTSRPSGATSRPKAGAFIHGQRPWPSAAGVKDFLNSLSGKVAQKITWVLRLLEDLEVIPSSYFKKLVGTEVIWECRVQFGSNAYRIFCFFLGNSVVVLTHGYVKKSQPFDSPA
jgi:hypothetical protein